MVHLPKKEHDDFDWSSGIGSLPLSATRKAWVVFGTGGGVAPLRKQQLYYLGIELQSISKATLLAALFPNLRPRL